MKGRPRFRRPVLLGVHRFYKNLKDYKDHGAPLSVDKPVFPFLFSVLVDGTSGEQAWVQSTEHLLMKSRPVDEGGLIHNCLRPGVTAFQRGEPRGKRHRIRRWWTEKRHESAVAGKISGRRGGGWPSGGRAVALGRAQDQRIAALGEFEPRPGRLPFWRTVRGCGFPSWRQRDRIHR